MSVSKVPNDTRHTLRYPLEADIDTDSQSNFWSGFTENISEGGVFVSSTNPPEIGDCLPVRISIQGDSMMVKAIVRWHRHNEQGEATGCGMQFVELDEAQITHLSTMLRNSGQTPLLYEP